MTSLQVTILLLATVAGAAANAKQSGALPKAWVPWATVIGAFAVAAGASLGQAQSLTVATVIAAIAAGVQALMAAATGIGLHVHFRMHKIASKAPANDNANTVSEAAKPAA